MSEAEKIWRERLTFLEVEEAKTVDPGQKFRLAKDIEEARSKLAALSKGESDQAVGLPDGDGEPEDVAAQPVLRLRRPPPPAWPAEPYPLLLPYSHPELFGGREAEIDELFRRTTGRQLILGFYAISGAGKSSLLDAGLIPRLRADGYAVARDREPAEAGSPVGSGGSTADGPVGRLLEDLIEETPTPNADSLDGFIEALAFVRRKTGKPPILILDQCEDLFRQDSEDQRTAVAAALTATAQRRGEWDDTVCRWLLSYRDEFHGKVSTWLSTLVPNLAEADRFHWWEPPTFGRRESPAETEAAFLDSIEKPLRLLEEGSAPRYACRFEAGYARRLAEAFARARNEYPEDPLVPELQVVLERLCREARSESGGVRIFDVPESVDALVGDALAEHLRAALAHVVPEEEREARTRRFLLLRSLSSLATADGRREPPRAATELESTLGTSGADPLAALASSRWRVLLARTIAGDLAYQLSHDRLAEAVRAENDRTRKGDDAELARLADLVRRRVQDFADGQREVATRLRWADYRALEQWSSLVAGDATKRWWTAVRWARRRRSFAWLGGCAAILAFLVSASVLIDRYQVARQLDNGTGPERLERLVRLGRLLPWEIEEVSEPTELAELAKAFEGVPEAWPEEKRSEIVYRAVRAARPLLSKSATEWQASDFAPLGLALRLLDRFPGRDPKWQERAATLRSELLAPLGPPPTIPEEEWVDIPPWPTEGRVALELVDAERADQGWVRTVRLKPFRMLRSLVTVEMYRELVPDWPIDPHAIVAELGRAPEVPAEGMTWDAAYVYAAWVGGRLPTEAEWELAARVKESKVVPPAEARPVGITASELWGLLGRLELPGPKIEWTVDWVRERPTWDELDPWGPHQPEANYFIVRGGGFANVFAFRPAMPYPRAEGSVGFRVVQPARRAGKPHGTHTDPPPPAKPR